MLFTPLQLGGKRLKNRIAFPAVLSIYAQQNRVTQRLIDYYAARAAGGAAMLITEGLAIDASSVPQPGVATVFDPANFEGFQRLAQAVERHDCRLVGQLWHVGRQALWNPVDAPVGVSSLPDAYSWSVAHVMNAGEIRGIVDAYVDSARTLQRAGFSGVELHGGHGYLITQFLSPWSNVRDDEYGGDLERRTRFARDIVAGIRAACGNDFIVGLKMPGDEGVKGGIDGDEAGRIAVRLAKAGGLDYLGFAQGNFSPSLEDHTPDMNYPAGPFMALQKRLRGEVKKQAAQIAVLAFGRVLDADHAEKVLADGAGDFVAMGRALVADAALPNKAQAGQRDKTRPCIFCNVCWAEIHAGKPIACIHNPHLGTPDEAAWAPKPSTKKRKVVVVGSGVAGLEAAWVAASRGHDVTLLGSRDGGGKARLESKLPGRAEVAKVFEFQLARAREAGVRLELGAQASADAIAALQPHIAVLATGSKMRPPALSADSEQPMDARDFVREFCNEKEKRKGTAVLFDQDHGAGVYALADLLAATYERLVLVTPRTQLGRAIAYVNLLGVYRRLYKARAEIAGASVPTRFKDGRLTYANAFNGDEKTVDGVALFTYATPRIASDELAAPLRAKGIDVRIIGDAFAPRAMLAAVHEGHHLGNAL
jgi:2,4-dienoyl-CoA reductase-like NADH-dependent reductase (Old Yellow Enzyme family)